MSLSDVALAAGVVTGAVLLGAGVVAIASLIVGARCAAAEDRAAEARALAILVTVHDFAVAERPCCAAHGDEGCAGRADMTEFEAALNAPYDQETDR